MCNYIVEVSPGDTIAQVFKTYPDDRDYHLIPVGIQSIYPIAVFEGNTYMTVGGVGDTRIRVKIIGLDCDGNFMRFVTDKGLLDKVIHDNSFWKKAIRYLDDGWKTNINWFVNLFHKDSVANGIIIGWLLVAIPIFNIFVYGWIIYPYVDSVILRMFLATLIVPVIGGILPHLIKYIKSIYKRIK